MADNDIGNLQRTKSINENDVNDNISIYRHQISDSATSDNHFIIFENALSNTPSLVSFKKYIGTHLRYHQHQNLFVAEPSCESSLDDVKKEFSKCIEEILASISPEDLLSYIINIRTGVIYMYSRQFLFRNSYPIQDFYDLIKKKIPTTDEKYYFQEKTKGSFDNTLRSAFCNVKPISMTERFSNELRNYEFFVAKPKYTFRIYLQLNNQQTHICIVDPDSRYSIVEILKDTQRTSNIDFIRDRSKSKYYHQKSFDDIFDFRIQFQYSPCTKNNRNTMIEHELSQDFPLLDENFKNEYILRPTGNDSTNNESFYISEQLCKYIKFIRRDFGDVYDYKGNDELFEHFTIYLESSVEYRIDYDHFMCHPVVDTRGLVYARLNLDKMVSNNQIDKDLLIDKLWDMSYGLTTIASKCTTARTRQATNYYSSDGKAFNVEDERIVQQIFKRNTLPTMLALPNNIDDYTIKTRYKNICDQLNAKWDSIPNGTYARDKLQDYYERYLNESNYNLN